MGLGVRRCLALSKYAESHMRLRLRQGPYPLTQEGQVRCAGTKGPASDAIDNPPLKLSKREKQRRREASAGNTAVTASSTSADVEKKNVATPSTSPPVEKLRRVGHLVVPWHVKKRWLRHMKQHGLFLQWLAFIARRHYIDDTRTSADRTPFEKACSRIVLSWGVPFMVDEGMRGGGEEEQQRITMSNGHVTKGEEALPKSYNSALPALYHERHSSIVGQFVHGPAHITPFADLDVRDGGIAIDLLTGLPNIESAADVSGTRQLYDLRSLVGPSAVAHPLCESSSSALAGAAAAAAPPLKAPFSSPFPWLPEILSAQRVGTKRPNTKRREETTARREGEKEAKRSGDDDGQKLCLLPSSTQFAAHVPTQSMWYNEKFCANLTTMIAEDKQKYLGNKEWGGYGPQMPAGESMAVALEKYAQRCALSSSKTSLTFASTGEPASATFFHEQQLRTVRDLSLVLPSRPLRQELENFPQEHALCEAAFEVISAWEGGGSLSTAALNRRCALAFRDEEDKENCASERREVHVLPESHRQLNHAQSSQGSSNTQTSSASSCAEKDCAQIKRSTASIMDDDDGDGFRNSISHCPLRWRPDVIIDVGGGNGTMPWLAGKRFGYGTTNVVNIERYVTANNIGFDGGRGPPSRNVSEDYGGDNNRCRVTDEDEDASGPVEIPHTGCFTSQLGHWLQEAGEGNPTTVAMSSARTATDTVESGNSCECCSGSGESSTAVRAQRWCRFGAGRWSPRELPYYRVVHKDIRDVHWANDVRYRADKSVVITKHLCGAGVDHLLLSFELQQFFPRYLFINSCCHMKSSYAEYINTAYLNHVMGIYNEEVYKAVTSRTSWLRQWGDAVNTNAKVASLADQLQWQHNVGKCIEGLMDNGRVQWLRERGYSAVMVEHVPSAVTPRNKLLIARRHDGLLGP